MAEKKQTARKMPHNLEAERALLGSVLLDNSALNLVLESLEASDFYSQAHQTVLQRMVDIAELGRTIDHVTLSDELARDGSVERVGGHAYLLGLTDGVPIGTTSGTSEYIRIIKDASTVRRVINAASNVAARAFDGAQEAEALLDMAQQQFFDIARERSVIGFQTPREIFKNNFGTIEKMMAPGTNAGGILSGFRDVDAITGGYQNGELIVIAARPSVGKTAYALNIGIDLAQREGPVGMFSLEMSKQSLVTRMLCSEAKVDALRVRMGRASKEDWGKITDAMQAVFQSPFYIDDSLESNMMQIRAKARRLKAEKKIKLFIVDYLQLIKGYGKFGTRDEEVSSISRSLKGMAKELGVPVIALCQLNRAPEKRGNSTPMLSDLRESGAIEQDADVVQFLFQKKEHRADPNPGAKVVTSLIAKQRNGPTGESTLTFMSRWVRFVDWIPDETFAFDQRSAAAANGR